jgi:hypothetical protein
VNCDVNQAGFAVHPSDGPQSRWTHDPAEQQRRMEIVNTMSGVDHEIAEARFSLSVCFCSA